MADRTPRLLDQLRAQVHAGSRTHRFLRDMVSGYGSFNKTCAWTASAGTSRDVFRALLPYGLLFGKSAGSQSLLGALSLGVCTTLRFFQSHQVIRWTQRDQGMMPIDVAWLSLLGGLRDVIKPLAFAGLVRGPPLGSKAELWKSVAVRCALVGATSGVLRWGATREVIHKVRRAVRPYLVIEDAATVSNGAAADAVSAGG